MKDLHKQNKYTCKYMHCKKKGNVGYLTLGGSIITMTELLSKDLFKMQQTSTLLIKLMSRGNNRSFLQLFYFTVLLEERKKSHFDYNLTQEALLKQVSLIQGNYLLGLVPVLCL